MSINNEFEENGKKTKIIKIKPELFDLVQGRQPAFTSPDGRHNIYYMTDAEAQKYCANNSFYLFAAIGDKALLLIEEGYYQISKPLFVEQVFDNQIDIINQSTEFAKKYKLYSIIQIVPPVGLYLLVQLISQNSVISLIVAVVVFIACQVFMTMFKRKFETKTADNRRALFHQLLGGAKEAAKLDLKLVDYETRYAKEHYKVPEIDPDLKDVYDKLANKKGKKGRSVSQLPEIEEIGTAPSEPITNEFKHNVIDEKDIKEVEVTDVKEVEVTEIKEEKTNND